jgi:hypothetical protein
MSKLDLPPWSEIKATKTYKEGRKEVDELVQQAMRPLAARLEQANIRLEQTNRLLGEHGNAIVKLEAEVAALKASQQERSERAAPKGPLDDLPTSDLPIPRVV